ncbi:hypothetical protein DFH09DRAFT_1082472 [Mycena vulgaris]|nr:hypothetical protein DFH09DRAFT_1082472 [Mycena vulgaris]
MRFLFISTAAFLLGVSGLAAGNPGGPSHVVPFKSRRASSIGARSWKRELLPKDMVNLEYANAMASFPSTTLKFTAHADTPILLLEDIDYLVDTITCHTFRPTSRTEVELNFRSEEVYTDVLNAWSLQPSFILVTFHLTCNLDDRRAAWLVSAVHGEEFYLQIKLTVQSIPLFETGAYLRISHTATGVSSAWRQPQALDARFDHLFDFEHVIDFAPRQQLFPVDPTQVLNSSELIDVSGDAGVQVLCVDCVSRTNFSVGIELDIEVLGGTLNAAHINVTVHQFDHEIQLETSIESATYFQQSVDVLRTSLPDSGVNILGIGSIGISFGAALSAELNVTDALNFTVGAKASIPAGATATFVMIGNATSSATGWNDSSFDLIPFRLNNGSLGATAALALAPVLDVEIEILGIGAEGRVSLNTPQLSATAHTQTNMTSECQPVGPDDFEYFSTAVNFRSGLTLGIDGSTSGILIPNTDVPIFSLPLIDEPGCFIIAEDTGDNATTATDTPSPTGTLLTVAAAAPTFDMQKIESFYSASGTLPTNVNYTQMAQATAIPSNIQGALDGRNNKNGAGVVQTPCGLLLIVGFTIITAGCW